MSTSIVKTTQNFSRIEAWIPSSAGRGSTDKSSDLCFLFFFFCRCFCRLVFALAAAWTIPFATTVRNELDVFVELKEWKGVVTLVLLPLSLSVIFFNVEQISSEDNGLVCPILGEVGPLL